MNRQQKIIIAALIFLPVVIGIFILAFENNDENAVIADLQGKRIGSVKIYDVIYSSENYVWQLRELRKDKSIGGVILRIESPGGAVAPSQEIYHEVLRYREEGKPLIVSMGNVAASGGYYIASPAMKIFANPGTITGSIGVIFRFPQYYKLMEKVGLKVETIKAGKFKDMGTPHRDMTPQERALLQQLIDDTHDQFISDVAAARSCAPDSLRHLADGSVFTGRQAYARGLVDTLGGYEEALGYLREVLGIPERSKLVEKRKRDAVWKEVLLEGRWNSIPFVKALTQPGGVYYLFEAY